MPDTTPTPSTPQVVPSTPTSGWNAAAGSTAPAQTPAQPPAAAQPTAPAQPPTPGHGAGSPQSSSPAPTVASAATVAQPGTNGFGTATPTATPSGVPAGGARPPQPIVITPVKKGGLAGLVSSMADVLTGVTRPKLATDQFGNTYIQQHTADGSEQWVRATDPAQLGPSQRSEWGRVLGEGIVGGANGLAAGRGINGGGGAAAAAGVKAGMKMNAAEDAKARQATLDGATRLKAQMDLAEHTFAATRLQTEATQNDIKFSQQQQHDFEQQGGVAMGTVAHPGDITGLLHVDPDLAQHWIQDHTINFTTAYDADGKPAGLLVYKMPGEALKKMMPVGTTFQIWDSTQNKLVPQKTAEPMTQGEIDTLNATAQTKSLAYANQQQEQKLKDAQTAEAAGRAAETPSKIAAQNAQANAANARAQGVKSGETLSNGQPNPAFENLAQAAYRGDLLPKDLKREARGADLDPNAVMARAVEIGEQNGKPWSESIIEQEHRFAESPKTQGALDGIDRIIGKPGEEGGGYLNQMLTLAQKADLGTNGAFNSAHLAISRFFGSTDAKNFQTAVSETRRSIAGLIGNPLLGSGESDKKLQQADAMLGGSPTMENLEGAAAILKTALATQRTSMIQNNRFLQKRYGGAQPQPQAAEPTALAADGKTVLVVRNGQWVPQQ